mmetsp:Transcript_21959/g.60951  ORF Transcript_21959/g.60951 Transcript_21959/m.60951 type:complete len:223 (+) Transcript_21959:412-1080(+)
MAPGHIPEECFQVEGVFANAVYQAEVCQQILRHLLFGPEGPGPGRCIAADLSDVSLVVKVPVVLGDVQGERKPRQRCIPHPVVQGQLIRQPIFPKIHRNLVALLISTVGLQDDSLPAAPKQATIHIPLCLGAAAVLDQVRHGHKGNVVLLKRGVYAGPEPAKSPEEAVAVKCVLGEEAALLGEEAFLQRHILSLKKLPVSQSVDEALRAVQHLQKLVRPEEG